MLFVVPISIGTAIWLMVLSSLFECLGDAIISHQHRAYDAESRRLSEAAFDRYRKEQEAQRNKVYPLRFGWPDGHDIWPGDPYRPKH